MLDSGEVVDLGSCSASGRRESRRSAGCEEAAGWEEKNGEKKDGDGTEAA